LTDYYDDAPDLADPADWWDPFLDKAHCPSRFRIPGTFNPLTDPPEGWSPDPGLVKYCEAAANDIDKKIHDTQPDPRPNLTREQKAAVISLRASGLVFGDCDKNLGLFCTTAEHYASLGLEELGKTHTEIIGRTPGQLISEALTEIRTGVEKHLHELPKWAAEYCREALKHAPTSQRKYLLPAFRILFKVHKMPLQVRPITGNHVWCTQPLALLLADLLQPYVTATDTYVKDTDDFTRRLAGIRVPTSTFLVTYDVERLYPSIPHDSCLFEVERHLRERGCRLSAFAVTILGLILSLNVCEFDNKIFLQLTGFATGVACGGEVAHLWLEGVLQQVVGQFHAFMQLLHVRYIDDGFLLWTGSYQSCLDFFTACNAVMPGVLTLTYEISKSSVVFLDLVVFRGAGWDTSGLLDTTCYQKPVNRYLYIPFCSEIPLATLRGWVKAEIIRYIKRCSSELDFLDILQLFWHRLRLRGYPAQFIRDAFDTAPAYSKRADLLYRTKPQRTGRMQMLITGYSHAKHEMKLGDVMHGNMHLLPPHLRGDFVLAYRSTAKLSSQFVTYRFPRKERSTDSLTPPLPRL
jgi:hypothetical protein